MLNPIEINLISDAITSAEEKTSGEIRVCVARKCKKSAMEMATAKFHELKMHETKKRNGVLIYVCPSDHKAAILGDIGINEAAKAGFWDNTLNEMLSFFSKDLIAEGICKGVGMVGELIKARYPIDDNDVNELQNEVIFEE